MSWELKLKHDISKLPKWAQKLIQDQKYQIERMKALEKAHQVLQGKEWFTIHGPTEVEKEKYIKLWFLCNSQPFPVATLYHKDILLIGRAKRS